MAEHYFGENGKRDIHGQEKGFEQAFDKLQTIERWVYDGNRMTAIRYLMECRRGRAKSAGHNKKVGKSSLYRVMGVIRSLSEHWIRKDFEQATPDDWEAFYDRMECDQLKQLSGQKYKPSTKAKIYKTVRKFLKWKFGNNKTYPEFCDEWVTREEIPTKDAISRSDVEKMELHATKLKGKAMVMILFDGGFRIEELGNLRWVDVRKKEDKDYYVAHIRKETSKTKKERHVSLSLSTPILSQYEESERLRLGESFRETSYIFPDNYDVFLKFIHRLSIRAIGKRIGAHDFRHASATYYSQVIKTYQQFCYRYGWDLKSGTAQRYFHANDADEVAITTKQHEMARMKVDFERAKIERDNYEGQVKIQRSDAQELRAEIREARKRDKMILDLLQTLVEQGDKSALMDALKKGNLLGGTTSE